MPGRLRSLGERGRRQHRRAAVRRRQLHGRSAVRRRLDAGLGDGECYSEENLLGPISAPFDPAFHAGYPKTPVFDSGSRPAELFAISKARGR
jgi:hypothetical protein